MSTSQQVETQIVQIFVREVYGNGLVYPANVTADRFASLLNVKTFNSHQLAKMKALGFTVQPVTDPRSLSRLGTAA